MRNFFTLLLTLFTVTSVAVAQPAMIKKGYDELSITTCQQNEDRETFEVLEVEIIPTNGDPFHHPQHPENGLICPIRPWLTTSQEFSHYHWESSYNLFAGDPNEPHIRYFLDKPGFVKVEVWDDLGNFGSDSIWFQIKENKQIDNFLMEIDEDMHPVFSGIVSDDQIAIDFYRENYTGGEDFGKTISLTPGQWIYKDEDAYYDEQNLWVYHEYLYDTCRNSQLHVIVPGLLLDVRQEGGWHLYLRSLLQEDNGYYHENFGVDFAYIVYTIDELGERHQFIQGGQPVKLGQYEAEWNIPGSHVDPYYQCGVARILEDGSFELLSLSNKVDNPLHDTNGMDEDERETSFSVYPNPAQGRFAVEGIGTMTVTNTLGQTVLTQEIDGKTIIELPQGMYFVKLGGETRKIVVE